MAEQSESDPREPLYGGYSRFELELEFVQSLSNPLYLSHLATQKYLDDPAFIAYLDYLQYFREPKYAKYLSYPGPTLKVLEYLQQPRFRQEIRVGETAVRLSHQMVSASFDVHS